MKVRSLNIAESEPKDNLKIYAAFCIRWNWSHLFVNYFIIRNASGPASMGLVHFSKLNKFLGEG